MLHHLNSCNLHNQTIKRKKKVYYNEFSYYNFKNVAIETYCNENISLQTIAIKSMAIGYCNKKQH